MEIHSHVLRRNEAKNMFAKTVTVLMFTLTVLFVIRNPYDHPEPCNMDKQLH